MDEFTPGTVVLTPLPADDSLRRDLAEPATLTTRLAAKLFAGRLDKQLAAGVAPEPGSALAVHVSRLASAAERRALAGTLRDIVLDAHSRRAVLSSRVPVNRPAVVAAAAMIDRLRMRLLSPRPVSARGVARLRVLLTNGGGPVYRSGSGDLAAELRAVLALL